ncbi:hypothetical protein Goarm_009032 [Gossypium armourianum]|uniref:tRNA pseudouridine(55) synthase n=1 Tax=Gossypium armourianum TaxID=34283 RepID=A0A7J9JRS6_9ROSI|nr:hypothetical protein [Gossypium armourianum]
MSNEVESAQVSDAMEVAQLSSLAAVDSHAGSCEAEMPSRLLNDAVRSLPYHVVKDLLSIGVCSRCVLRILGTEDHIYCHSSFSQSMLCSVLEEVTGFKSEGDFQFCSVCLGILQLSYRDDKEMLVKMESPNDMALVIAELVKKEGHQIDGFSLEDTKASASSFRIRLAYTHKMAFGNSVERNQGFKRRKIGTENGLQNVNDESVVANKDCSDYPTNETIAVTGRSSLKVPIDKVSEPCHLVYLCYRTHIYLCGRYLKYSRNVSQTRWIIDEERMGEASVEIQNARQVPSEETVKEIESKINGLENKLVGVKNLQVVGSQGWTLMREGEAEKQKQYCALVWISRPLEDEDVCSISLLNDMQILQKTPIRVLHRRSPLERKKIIHWMKIERIAESSQYFLLHLCTQAGTYIKEFVHGDFGRTQPSIGSILGCRAEILQLDVTDVKMDSF